jgi:hypothetical protein
VGHLGMGSLSPPPHQDQDEPAGRCECRPFPNETPCGAPATWLVRIGTRQYDAQRSCARHLSMTCIAMGQADRPALTVTRIGWPVP